MNARLLDLLVRASHLAGRYRALVAILALALTLLAGVLGLSRSAVMRWIGLLPFVLAGLTFAWLLSAWVEEPADDETRRKE